MAESGGGIVPQNQIVRAQLSDVQFTKIHRNQSSKLIFI